MREVAGLVAGAAEAGGTDDEVEGFGDARVLRMCSSEGERLARQQLVSQGAGVRRRQQPHSMVVDCDVGREIGSHFAGRGQKLGRRGIAGLRDLQGAHAGNGGGLGDGGGGGFDGGQGGIPRLHANYRHQRGPRRVAQRVQTRAYGHSAAAETHGAGEEGDTGGAGVEEFQVLGTLPGP